MSAWVVVHVYEPDGVDLHTESVPESLTPSEARELATRLIRAAEEVEYGLSRIAQAQ